MEIAKSLHSPILLLLLLLLLFAVDARSIGARNRHHNKKLLLNLRNLPWSQNKKRAPTDCTFQKPKVGNGATTLQMKERDDCSGKVIDWDENLQNRVLRDAIHVKALQSRVRSAISHNKPLGISESQIPISLGQPFQTLNYVVTVGIGGQNLTLIVDTGSDITWVQCRPCRKCYTQQEPIFDPSNSTSFLSLPCNSTTCSSLVYGHCAPGTKNSSPCNYEISYGDGSYSKGDFAYERLTLGMITVDKFIIGCGQTNEGLYGETSGLMGFDRDKLSIVSQTSSVFGGIFSYCLPATGDGTSGSLTMGGGDFSSFRNVSPISYTRMISDPEMPSFYLLNVTGISIGGVKLNTPRFASSGNGVTSLLDSGTTITRLPPSVYDAFKAEFEKQCPELRKVPGYSILEACYNLTEVKQFQLPSVKFYFEGDAVLTVDVQGMLYFLKSDYSQTCLAFARLSGEDQLGIIGSYQQKNQRVLYNTQESKVGFAVETCSF